MQFVGRRFGWTDQSSVDLFGDRSETETLSQALSTAAADEADADGSVLFGTLRGNVVGLKYYTGVVNAGEMVSLVRQPQNQYDRNAVMVVNVYGSQVGHIKRELAAAMATIMDNNLAKVEGMVPSGMNNAFTMPVLLSFWGKEESKDQVVGQLGRHRYKLGPPDSKRIMVPGNSSQGLYGPARKSTAIPLTAKELKNAFDSLFEDLMEVKNGEIEAADAVCTPLLPHQKQALAWMCACENNSALPPFWEERGGLFFNTLTCFSVRERPQRTRGGILADDMGLGKTLTTIALILSNFHHGKPLPLGRCRKYSSDSKPGITEKSPKPEKCAPKSGEGAHKEGSGSSVNPRSDSQQKTVCWESIDFMKELEAPPLQKKAKSKGRGTASQSKKGVSSVHLPVMDGTENSGARATLIICPLSVLSNWLDQFEQHVRGDVEPRVYLYYGSERSRDTSFLSAQDVVLTTYNVLSADHGGTSPLHVVNWLRVVLDEGHVIRNPNAQQSKAVLALNAHRRWILSGTPIQNSVKDLWMLLAFLRLKPFDVKEWWTRVIQRPVTQGDQEGLVNLQTLVKCITLRRTKNSEVAGRPLVVLPQKKVCVEYVTLSQREREEYELARTQGRTTISRYVADGTVLKNYADVLAILVRLRQHCCHCDLLPKTSSDNGLAATPAELRERLVQRLRLVLASGSDEECPVCLDSVRLPVITHCAHVYCRACIAQVISSEQEQACCPLCRGQIRSSELVEFVPEELEEDNSPKPHAWRSSTKVEALMSNLLALRESDSSIKSLVVSQFTCFLNLLEVPLREHGFSYVRLDGSLSQKRRAQVIQEFQSSAPDSPLVMLLSLKAGGVGLNLTAASQVFMMDPAWNPAAEDQCVDRCYRLGQKRDVTVTKFIVRNSVEENMVEIQRRKKDLVEKTFGSEKPADSKTSRIDHIRALMEL
ncbi:helicase-like transcription factor [Osmerus eperlanus]|uniref:helicase-like transcription factor n=1 Tax=Osmerus eperlanus TaxID=29151 RepID=UPI002E1262FF